MPSFIGDTRPNFKHQVDWDSMQPVAHPRGRHLGPALVGKDESGRLDVLIGRDMPGGRRIISFTDPTTRQVVDERPLGQEADLFERRMVQPKPVLSLADRRGLIAEAIYQAYDFGGHTIAAANGWEYGGDGDLSRVLFFEPDPDTDPDDTCSRKGHFTVQFAPCSAELLSATATLNGDDIGSLDLDGWAGSAESRMAVAKSEFEGDPEPDAPAP